MFAGSRNHRGNGPAQPGAFPWANQIVAAGLLAVRPAAHWTNAGYLYYATDTALLYRSSGAAWTTLHEYAYIVANGMNGGQTLYGGTGAGDGLTLHSTSHATRGLIYLYDNARMGKAVILTGIISPSQITSNQDNYAPTGAADAAIWRLSSDASRNITGILAGASNTAGDLKLLINVGSQDIVLKDETTSTADNRFALNADVTLGADQSALIWYDTASSRWRLAAGPGSTSGSGPSAATQAEQEAGSSTTVYTSPGRQHYHPSAVKAWAQITGGAGTAAIQSPDYNCDAITENATGDFTIPFTTDFSSAVYGFAGLCQRDTSSDNILMTVRGAASAIAGASLRIATINTGGTRIACAYAAILAAGDHA